MNTGDRRVKLCGRELGAALLVLPLVMGCGSGQQGPTGAGSQSVTSTTLPATTAAIPGGCPSGIGAAAQVPTQAAQCLYEAWVKGDRRSAAVFASLDVVAALFEAPWTPPPGTFLGCVAEAGGGQRCSVEHHRARWQFEVQRSEGGWRVTQVQQS